MIQFRTTSGVIVAPAPYAVKGSVPKKGDRGTKNEPKAETAEE